MKLTERLIYLLIILFLVCLISLEYVWFRRHYSYLLNAFDYVFAKCK